MVVVNIKFQFESMAQLANVFPAEAAIINSVNFYQNIMHYSGDVADWLKAEK